MALTAHFLVRDNNNRLKLRNTLLAFRVIEGSHEGKNLGGIMFEIIKDAKLLRQVCVSNCFLTAYVNIENLFWQLGEFTFDNAGNCNTTMETLEALLKAEGIPFCRYGNRIRFVN